MSDLFGNHIVGFPMRWLILKQSCRYSEWHTDSGTSGKHDPIDTHFYIENLVFAGIFLIFLFLLQNIDCGYSLEEAVLTCTHNVCFEQK